MKKNLLPLTTPGEVLNEEFLIPLGISQYRLAKDIGISARRINEIVHGQRAITPDTALRLGKYFGVSAQFWLNLQARYDLQTAERSADFLSSIRPYNNTTALAA
ncbi:MAG: HigA family addiction module antitoxin [Methylacidiphilales bacterium]|nr:HigA family addiction module antitoxin [Candidatus Methylacidiphilales bacterium]